MTTHWLRADRITTADFVVTGGETNPLNQGGKRRAWKVAEAKTADGRTTLRIILVKQVRGEWVRDAGSGWITQAFDAKFKLRVLTR
jgi:hypothetical protein